LKKSKVLLVMAIRDALPEILTQLRLKAIGGVRLWFRRAAAACGGKLRGGLGRCQRMVSHRLSRDRRRDPTKCLVMRCWWSNSPDPNFLQAATLEGSAPDTKAWSFMEGSSVTPAHVRRGLLFRMAARGGREPLLAGRHGAMAFTVAATIPDFQTNQLWYLIGA
jgi:hypothetical protein